MRHFLYFLPLPHGHGSFRPTDLRSVGKGITSGSFVKNVVGIIVFVEVVLFEIVLVLLLLVFRLFLEMVPNRKNNWVFETHRGSQCYPRG